jgi:hypothetical protein
VSQAVAGLAQLAKAAHGTTAGAQAAKTDLANIQHDLYLAGYYGKKQPLYGSLSGGNLDLDAFRKAMVDAAHSGTKAGEFLSGISTQATQAGASGTGTGIHVIPPEKINQTVYTAADIQDTVDAAAQKLIGRKPTADEVQGVLSIMNSATGAKAQAQASTDLAAQQQQVAVNNAAYGTNVATDVASGTVTPQQVAQAIATAGGSALQQQVGAALTGGIESGGQLNDKNPKSTASGLFQFLTTTWASNGGTAFAPTAGQATLQQQAQVFLNASRGDNFSPWAPDVGGSYNGKGWKGAPDPNSKVGKWLAANGSTLGTTAQTGQGTTASAGLAGTVSPVGPGLKQGRVDQGVDWSGAGPLYAVGSGTIVSTKNAGWPGGAFIALKLDHPVDAQHSVVYYAEDINPQVQVGEHVGAGRQIGTANGGHSGIEIGWGDPVNLGRALSAATGTAGSKDNSGGTPEGQHFLSYISGASPVTGTAQAGAQGQTTDVFQAPVIGQVPADPSQTEAAANFFETQRSPEYQANNLLNVFGVIQNRFGANAAPAANIHVRATPLAMK